jgi:hypothetical protein
MFARCKARLTSVALRPFIFSFFILLSQAGFAQMQFAANGTQTIDFVTTIAGVNNGAFTASGITNVPASGQLNSNAWEFIGWNDGNTVYGGNYTSGDYARGQTNVAVSTGGTYAYTGAPGSVANPSLMVQEATNDFTPGTITLRVKNTSATSILNQVAVSYKLFCRNDQIRGGLVKLQWSSDNVNYDDVPSTSYTSAGPADALGWQNVATPSATISGFSVAPNNYFYIRWFFDDDLSLGTTGARDEFGLDDIAVTASFANCASTPTVNAVVNSVTNLFTTSASVNFTRGNGTGGMMAVISAGALSTTPTNGVQYTGNTNYGNGSALGNGYVVYFSNGVTAGNSGTINVTGLTASTNYTITLFEYTATGPCYALPGSTSNFTTASSTAANASYYFRAKNNGLWSWPLNWEFSTDGITYSALPCDLAPTQASSGIIIPAGITIDIQGTVSMDQTTLGGTLRLLDGGIMNIYDGSGTDLDIQTNGLLQIISEDAYTNAVKYPSGTPPSIAVATNAIIRIGNGGSVGSGYGGFAGSGSYTVWANGSIFDWNSTTTFATSNQTYFPTTQAGAVPIFRVSKTPSIAPGATLKTYWNGVIEVNAPLTLRNGGVKQFIYGITGTSTLTADATSGNILIGDTAVVPQPKTASLNIPLIGLSDVANINLIQNCTLDVLNNCTINSVTTGMAGFNVVPGSTLNCGDKVISGSCYFSLQSGGNIYVGDANGITVLPSALGNIRVLGSRTYSSGANYRYTGTTDQVTGNGLPSTHASLTIACSTGKTVTLTTNNSSSTSLTLTSGLFAIGVAQTYNITSGGTVAVTSGNFASTPIGSGGTVNFTAGGTMTGTSTPFNLYVGNGGLTCPSGSDKVTIQPSGSFRINAGGWLAGTVSNGIYYSIPSTLEYNSGGNYSSGIEWIQNANGSIARGGPNNVTILNNTQLQLNAGATQIMTGNLVVNSGCQLALNTSAGKDLTVGGNWTRAAGSTFTNNGRKVTFNGLSDQTITLTGSGTEVFALIRIDKGTSTLKLASGANATSISLTGSSGATNSLEFIKGNMDLAQNTFYFNINYSNTQTNNILIDGISANALRNITSTGGTGTISCYNFDNSNSRNLVVSRPGSFGTLILSNTVTLTVGGSNAGGIDFGTTGTNSLVTINGIFQLNTYGFAVNNPPNYGAGSYLIYNTGNYYNRNVEWQTAAPGLPYNVTLQNTGTFVYLNTAANGTADRSCLASLRIMAGAQLALDGQFGNNYANKLTVTDSVYIAGTLELGNIIGGDLYVGKYWKRVAGGVFTDHNREVEFFGSTNSLIEAPVAETFSYVSINKTGSAYVRADSAVNIKRRLRFVAGQFTLLDKDVTFKSDVNYTAYLDNVPSATSLGYTGAGRFVVERFIATGTGGYPYHGKSWQLLAVPVNDAGGVNGQTVNQAWQEGQLPGVVGTAGLGTFISNNVAGSGGFDLVAGVGPSMKTYNPVTNNWDGIAGTGIKHYNSKGYMILVRGDRSVQTAAAPSNNTTLRTRGKVFAPNNAPATISVPANLFETIGNPYAAPIKFSALSRTNIKNVFYLWDPRLTTGSAYGLGAYQTFSFDGANYRVSPGGGSYGALNSICDTIQSGLAFFVQATTAGTGTVGFSESAKAGGFRLATRLAAPSYRPESEPRFLGARLYVFNQGTKELVDGVVSQFGNQFSSVVDDNDALKLPNTGESFSIKTDGKLLAAEKMGIPQNNDVIQYNLAQVRAMTYQLELVPENLNISGLKAFLEDRYLNLFTDVSLQDTTRYDFSLNASIPASYAADRFRIVFRKGKGRQPEIRLYAITSGKASTLAWAPEGKVDNTGVYELKGLVGDKWVSLSLSSAGEPVQSWEIPADQQFAQYRVTYSLGNQHILSNRLSVDAVEPEDHTLNIYPNPVNGSEIHISLATASDTDLVYSIVDGSGKRVQSGSLKAIKGSARLTVPVPMAISNGIYRLELEREGRKMATRQILIQRR